ncbi:hypothetical protein [Paenibacillus sp. J2TS4]|uniref:hypothetical protein n=1 Tax=Paenibacillus sp. J2TS4 TaxID=2807194 RepID=UPI001B0AB0A4|nr:hypothetical protein [Paenibacillus sp. J2TS4]GIP31692.1 hypothetical protein J2TS4_09020 [Paenibacillus sp. J2TS4]
MIASRSERSGFKKSLLAAAALIGASALLFQGFAQAATASEFKNTNTTPASYANYTTGSSQTAPNSLPEGYIKANYTVGALDLEYYRNQTPTSNDMTKEEAAEIGAQALWELFGLNLEGQVIEMGYSQATENLPLSHWDASVLINGERDHYFSVDSVTGELLNISRASRALDKSVSIAFDSALDQNPGEYIALAEKLAEKYNVVHGAVQSVEYNGQGYGNHEPDISFDIIGENGEMALMSLSRYDQTLLGIVYSAEYKPTMESHEKFIKQVQEKVKELEKSSPPADDNEAPALMVLQ